MRNQAMTIPGLTWWSGMELAVSGLASRIPQLHLGQRLYESMLLLGVLALMSAFTVGTIVFVACTVAQTVAGAE